MTTILQGDCRDTLKTIPTGTVHCCVTSPPYWGLRAYLPKDHPDKAKEIGQEKTPEEYVETMVGVFREVRRCLHDSGTVWLNVGDSYASAWAVASAAGRPLGAGSLENGKREARPNRLVGGLKEKDLCMIPWRLAIALQADGWWLRSVICWAKKSCLPESVTDRPTNSWEPIFLLAKSARYFYDQESVKEPLAESSVERLSQDIDNQVGTTRANGGMKTNGNLKAAGSLEIGTRNQRNVWHLGPEPYREAHFAVFPSEIPRRSIMAGTSEKGCCPKCFAPWVRMTERPEPVSRKVNGRTPNGQTKQGSISKERVDVFPPTRTIGWEASCKCNAGEPIPCTVLDPFGGSGTTGQVALEQHRKAVLCELSQDYCTNYIAKRTAQQSLL